MKILTSCSIAITTLALGVSACAEPVAQGAKNVPEFEPAFANQTRAPAMQSDVGIAVETLASGLSHPWGIAEMPGGGFLVTEREGRLRVISADGELLETAVEGVPEVHAVKQGGLLDVALGPDFARDRMIYLTYSKPTGGGESVTAAARGVLSDDMTRLEEVEDIFVQDPPSPTPMHYGSRVVFDGDGHVFITTGEHSSRAERGMSQDLSTTYGKVIRLNLDGSVPMDNPFASEEGAIDTIWSYGHRNVQGAAYRDGVLWTLEHGPKGGDELNKTEAAKNYGWPVVSYGETYGGAPIGEGIPRAEGMEEPVYYWDPVIAPGGFDFYDGQMFGAWQGDILAGSLSPGGLVRLKLDGDGMVTGEERLVVDQGRIRDVEVTSDGSVLLLVDEANGAVLRLTPQD